MSLAAPSALYAAIGVMMFWLALGIAGLVRIQDERFVFRVLFPLGCLGGAGLVLTGLAGLSQPAAELVLPLGLPDLPFHLRLDPLSSFFLALLGLAATGISMYSAGYFRKTDTAQPGLTGLQYHLFLVSMAAVCLADDAYLFMVAWETMALSSYFLVTTDHNVPEIRRAGFLYLLIAHLGAI
jgi:hydrogenase-4 component B